ncbi:unnamed protein product [Protopolystoma xenopodis]|uniref:Uncharacterized protein n=1 Tax=Protopolystoma xenopodis TaxID=117903 RepID=A0A448WXC4_9PLAT|nr:unnamed protein product [Protopolystoma xenopodis]
MGSAWRPDLLPVAARGGTTCMSTNGRLAIGSSRRRRQTKAVREERSGSCGNELYFNKIRGYMVHGGGGEEVVNGKRATSNVSSARRRSTAVPELTTASSGRGGKKNYVPKNLARNAETNGLEANVASKVLLKNRRQNGRLTVECTKTETATFSKKITPLRGLLPSSRVAGRFAEHFLERLGRNKEMRLASKKIFSTKLPLHVARLTAHIH